MTSEREDAAKAQAAREPRVSIIIPVYNVEVYLSRCLNSILAQTMPEWECICVDDGSPDGCGAILDEYAARDARFVVIHKENGGVSSARNAGLDAARGEYIGFVDPDDWIEPSTYELALSAARENNADLVQWGVFQEWGGKTKAKVLPEGKFDVLSSPTCFSASMWNKLVSRKLICHNGLRFPENLRIAEDRVFSIECCLLAQCPFQIGQPLYHYVESPQSAMHGYTHEKFWDMVEAVKMMERIAHDFLSVGAKGDAAGNKDAPLIVWQKISCKTGAISMLDPPDFRLAREVFPEANRMIAAHFLRRKAPSVFALLLASWHLDFLLRLLCKAWKAAAKGNAERRRRANARAAASLGQAG